MNIIVVTALTISVYAGSCWPKRYAFTKMSPLKSYCNRSMVAKLTSLTIRPPIECAMKIKGL